MNIYNNSPTFYFSMNEHIIFLINAFFTCNIPIPKRGKKMKAEVLHPSPNKSILKNIFFLKIMS